MKLETMMPDYNHCILNLVNSILKYYKIDTKYNGLEKVDNLLERNYQNVVLVILDGMGEDMLKKNLPNGLFSQHKLEDITSVFPSTTTAAMTTYYSGKPPIETGWIAWTQYFKEYGKNIHPLLFSDATTGEKLKIKGLTINDIIGYKTIYEKIEERGIYAYEVLPSNCTKRSRLAMIANTVDDMCNSIVTLCKNTDSKFILAYNDNPDTICHKMGCYSEEVKSFLLHTEEVFLHMLEDLKGTNTLVIVSADHGHHNIGETIDNLELEEIQECLVMPPTFEPRMIGFFVKENKKKEFEKRFCDRFKDKYLLYTKEEFLASHLLGFGEKHEKIDDFLGDYIAVAIADTRILIETHLAREIKGKDEKKSTHCGLTRNEMEVPVIAFEIK